MEHCGPVKNPYVPTKDTIIVSANPPTVYPKNCNTIYIQLIDKGEKPGLDVNGSMKVYRMTRPKPATKDIGKTVQKIIRGNYKPHRDRPMTQLSMTYYMMLSLCIAVISVGLVKLMVQLFY